MVDDAGGLQLMMFSEGVAPTTALIGHVRQGQGHATPQEVRKAVLDSRGTIATTSLPGEVIYVFSVYLALSPHSMVRNVFECVSQCGILRDRIIPLSIKQLHLVLIQSIARSSTCRVCPRLTLLLDTLPGYQFPSSVRIHTLSPI